MIKKNNSLVRAEKIINSFINSTYERSNLDGVFEAFKQSDKQGYVLKIYKSFDPTNDLCVWIYEDSDNKTIHTVIGCHNDCDELNNYSGDELICNEYPIKIDIKKTIVEKLIEDVYSHYNKSFRI